jgi:hypothetical protein
MAETGTVRKLLPGGIVAAGGLGLVSCRDPWIATGMTVWFAGTVVVIYSILKEILDRFNMTLMDLL